MFYDTEIFTRLKFLLGTVPPGLSGVTGPVSSTNNDFPIFDGITGKKIKDSGIAVSSLATLSALQTVKTSISAINQFDYSLLQTGFFKFGYSISDLMTSAKVWTNASMSHLMAHFTYRYSGGILISGTHSSYGTTFGSLNTLQCAVTYQAGKIQSIIEELI